MTKLFLLSLLSVLLIGCAQTTSTSDPVPEHDTFTLESSAVGETRTICVWVPPGYLDAEARFPVLYMPDGGIKEDFPHIANTVAKLISNQTIPPLLLVGIENTERRRDLTGPSEVVADEKIAPLSDGASKFRSFINDELFAEVDKRYRTTGERGIIGESAAGLFVVETLMLRPEMFDIYIAMDPALYWNDRYLIRSAPEHLARFDGKPRRFWFAGSSASDIHPHTHELAKILESHSPASLEWKHSDQPNEKHKTIFRATKELALTWAINFDEKAGVSDELHLSE